MCRLFGYRSNTRDEVHGALAREQNSLRVQSREHPDGWGIAYYLGAKPVVFRGLAPAHGDPEFERREVRASSCWSAGVCSGASAVLGTSALRSFALAARGGAEALDDRCGGPAGRGRRHAPHSTARAGAGRKIC